MKKVAIVGRGTAGALGALHLDRYLDKSKFEIEWIFDESIPTQSVGEGSTLALPTSLFQTTGFSHSDLPKLGGSIKTGLKKSGWGIGTEFDHDFGGGGVGYHFQAQMLHNYSLDYLKDKVQINDRHTYNQEVDADYVFDCSGTPKELGDEFIKSEHITVNTARVWQCPWDEPKFNHTLTLARPYGWVFGVPLSNRLSIGYIYNKDYASLEMIEEDIKEVFKEYNIEPGEDGNYIEFNSYWRNENFDGRVGYSGNASFFLEPLEATSTATMDVCNRNMYDMVTGITPLDIINKNYNRMLSQTENLIMFHYYAGSQWDTDFWRYAKNKGEEKLSTVNNDSRLRQSLLEGLRMVKANDFRPMMSGEYGIWSPRSFALHLKSLGITDKIRSLLQ